MKTDIKWTKGELIFLALWGVFLLGLVVFSIIRDAPHP